MQKLNCRQNQEIFQSSRFCYFGAEAAKPAATETGAEKSDGAKKAPDLASPQERRVLLIQAEQKADQLRAQMGDKPDAVAAQRLAQLERSIKEAKDNAKDELSSPQEVAGRLFRALSRVEQPASSGAEQLASVQKSAGGDVVFKADTIVGSRSRAEARPDLDKAVADAKRTADAMGGDAAVKGVTKGPSADTLSALDAAAARDAKPANAMDALKFSTTAPVISGDKKTAGAEGERKPNA